VFLVKYIGKLSNPMVQFTGGRSVAGNKPAQEKRAAAENKNPEVTHE
jgi:hypothetical protein